MSPVYFVTYVPSLYPASTTPVAAANISAGVAAVKGFGNLSQPGSLNASTALQAAVKWQGNGYREMAPGVYRSADGLRQFRMTTGDITGTHGNMGPHIHFEALNFLGKVVENLHIELLP